MNWLIFVDPLNRQLIPYTCDNPQTNNAVTLKVPYFIVNWPGQGPEAAEVLTRYRYETPQDFWAQWMAAGGRLGQAKYEMEELGLLGNDETR